ncbi:MAG: carboxypeptidase-like regulatory domain-containing protein [Ignavibacteria bacterium]|nr:carboxypeptidase-like regulatory domain-containing protein [Ignavibacteria bacterium]
MNPHRKRPEHGSTRSTSDSRGLIDAPLWCLVVLIAALNMSRAQGDVTLSGSVFDTDSVGPLRFVSVRVLETRSATMTDKRGAFLLRIPRAQLRGIDTLSIVFSLVGYAPDTVRRPAGDAVLEVGLEERAHSGLRS